MNSNQAHRYREIAVKTATPLQLVVILYDGAIQALQEAQEHIKQKNIAQRSQCLNRATAMISELHASLSFDEGGEIANSLDRLYAYMQDQIFKANLEQRIEPLANVTKLLENLRDAWRALASKNRIDAAPPAPIPPGNAGISNTVDPAPTGSISFCG
jgi:flagellar protein FliS